MALPTSLKLFIDAKAGRAYPTYSSTSPISNPNFYLGDQCKLELFLVEDTGLASFPRQEVPSPSGLGIRVAVGQIDSSPTAGHFTLTFGGNTTQSLDYNVTAAMMETRLNQLASIHSAGDVTVSKVGDNYAVKFNTNGNRAAITADAGNLIPLSTVGISVLQEGTSSLPEIVLIHLQQTVAALATSFTPSSPSTPTVTTLQVWDGTKVAYRLDLDPAPKGGTFSLSFDALTGTDVSTGGIPVGATAAEVQSFLNAGALADKVTVQQVGAYSYDISCAVQPDTAGLTADGSGLLSFSGYAGTLDINTSSAISLLDGAESIQTSFEVEISSGGDTLTALQIPCTLRSAVIDEAAVNPISLDPVLTEGIANGIYLQITSNLSEVDPATARTNLSVYSKTEVDALTAGGGGGGGLPLSGGAMDSGAVITLSNGTNDSELGGWGLGVELSADTSQGSVVEYNQVRSYNGSGGTSISPSGVTFPDNTTQSTAAVPFNGGTVSAPITVTGSGGSVTLADTGLDLSASTAGGQVKVGSSGIMFSDSTTLTTAPASGLSYRQTIAQSISSTYAGSFYWAGSYYATGFYFPSSGQIYNDWVTSGKFKVSVGGYLFSFSYLSSGAQYLNNTDDTSTVSLTGTGETLHLHYDGETAPYPFLTT